MTHLVCKAHKRRVAVVLRRNPPLTVVVHRNGDGSECDTAKVIIDGKEYSIRVS